MFSSLFSASINYSISRQAYFFICGTHSCNLVRFNKWRQWFNQWFSTTGVRKDDWLIINAKWSGINKLIKCSICVCRYFQFSRSPKFRMYNYLPWLGLRTVCQKKIIKTDFRRKNLLMVKLTSAYIETQIYNSPKDVLNLFTKIILLKFLKLATDAISVSLRIFFSFSSSSFYLALKLGQLFGHEQRKKHW